MRRNVTKKKKPPIYRVMLHNDTFNRREYVVSVLLKVVDGLAMDDAVNVMQACRQTPSPRRSLCRSIQPCISSRARGMRIQATTAELCCATSLDGCLKRSSMHATKCNARRSLWEGFLAEALCYVLCL